MPPAARQPTPYDTQHTVDPSWPLTVVISPEGASAHACADCGALIPDGVVVERDPQTGRVKAWGNAGVDGDGKQLKTALHSCKGKPSG